MLQYVCVLVKISLLMENLSLSLGGGVKKAKMGKKEIALALSDLSVKVNDCLPCL